MKRYNFWNGNVLELEFIRYRYTDKIIDNTGNKLVKVFVGQHRASKSLVVYDEV